MTVNELADWFRVNEHKFIFYLYSGGSGGEYVCSILAEQKYNKHGDYITKWKRNNQFTFKDWMLKDSIPEYDNGEDNFQTYEELASYILSINSLDSNVLQKFSEQDEQYVIRVHTLKIFPGLFTKSKVYECWDGDYDDYVCTILNAKIKLKPIYKNEEKLEEIKSRHKIFSNLNAKETRKYFEDSSGDDIEYSNLTPLDKIIKYADSVITNGEKALHDYTINMMCHPNAFDIDFDKFPIEDLQSKLRQLHLSPWSFHNRHTHRWWKILHLNEVYNESGTQDTSSFQSRSNAIKIYFRDLFTNYTLFDKDFIDRMIQWDKNNMKYLESLGFEEPPHYWLMPCKDLY